MRLVGGVARYYDVRGDISRLGIDDIVETTGYVDDEAFDRHVRESDVCLCLRWPTNREASGPWYRCLSAGNHTGGHTGGCKIPIGVPSDRVPIQLV
jgi:hypothetical protein